MANSYTTQAIEALASEIGENIYIDVANWHLYLAEAHLHTVVAEQVYSLIEEQALNQEAVLQVLRHIRVKLGGGKLEVALADLIPPQIQLNLVNLLEEYQRNL
jgi:hypothetical protein